MKIVIGGAAQPEDIPGFDQIGVEHEIAFAPDDETLRRHLPEAEVFVSWSFRNSGLERNWDCAGKLKWLHWCGAGVKPALFPALVDSKVVLTNARGIFDQAMAEYVLGMVLSFSIGLPGMLAEQAERRWTYRQSELLKGTRAAVFGVGGIGQRIGELLRAVGVSVTGIGRTPRQTETVFGRVLGREDRFAVLAKADWIIAVMPDTPDTEGYFGADEFRAMRHSARFLNIGRGNSVDEPALVEALRRGQIAGAALDVFAQEPLPEDSLLWSVPNLIITPHVSGDFQGYERAMFMQFLENLERFAKGKALLNVVDKHAGYVPASLSCST
ncbi:D-2-hydroxyacid dehydrogenase [Paracoccus sp. MKU1]|uniref:D-2-hydroxyacid dehydrogenase n=1 Tax=Paracoccus sp. MKU1 TaxID=1745182 RepID=UPI0007190936|nr:D-2-hydroxyacid dehydrogenase [Paracoccus sp. MKU1]KRW96652.1 hypothetical protein AQY21_07965 [Paracoccus sp. MKU1]